VYSAKWDSPQTAKIFYLAASQGYRNADKTKGDKAMRKESSVPVKTNFLKVLTTSVLILLTLAILSACANIKTVKIPQEYSGAESKIVIVPIEAARIDAYFKKLNIEVLIDEITKAPNIDELKEIILATLVNWHPGAFLCEKISEELTKRGRTVIQESEIVPLPENIRHKNDAAGLWYNPDITIFDHSAIKNHYNPTAIMEVSFGDMMIFANGTLTIILTRVIEPNSNKVIARKRTVKNMRRAKYNLRDPLQRRPYVTNFKTEFESALSKEIPIILDKMGF